MVLEKTLESPLDCKEIQPVYPKGNQSWIFIGRTDVEAETPVLGHLMQRTDSLEKTLMLGKIEDRRRKGRQRLLDRITYSMDMSLSKHWWWTGKPGVQQFMGLQKVGHDWETELNWIHESMKLSSFGFYEVYVWNTILVFGSWYKWANYFSSLSLSFPIWINNDNKSYLVGSSCKFPAIWWHSINKW